MPTEKLSNEKILITGATGAIARPIAKFLARDNQVIGAARFSNPALRKELDEAGVETVEIDLEANEIDAIPTDVTRVIHYAYTRRPSGEFRKAIHVNAIGPGHVLKRCQNAKSALIISAATLYSIHEDPGYAYREEDDIGFARAPWGPSSPVSKVTLESTARFCAEAFDLKTTIVRPAVPYGCTIDMVTSIIHAVVNDKPVLCVHNPQPLSLIHIDDMAEQIAKLLDVATVPATILNWASDEVMTVQEIAAQVGALVGRTPSFQASNPPGVAKGSVIDTTKVRAVVGPCQRRLRDSIPELVAAHTKQKRR